MSDTYKARTVLREALEVEGQEQVFAAYEVLSQALYEEQDKARKAERTVEAYRTAIADLMAHKA